MGYFKVYLTKLLLLRHRPALKKELKKINSNIKDVEILITEIRSSITLISTQRYDEIKNIHYYSRRKAQEKDIYAAADKTKQDLNRYPSEFLPKSMIQMEIEFIKRCTVYLDKFDSIETEIGTVNQKLSYYYDGVAKFNDLVENQSYYISNTLFQKIKAENSVIYNFFSVNNPQLTDVNRFLDIYPKFNQDFVKRINRIFVDRELTKMKVFFSAIDGKSLDEQQRRAIITDEDGNLIVAGAGSGKTLTISGKVKYLVEKKGVKPEEILLVSFTRKAAEEMRQRIKNRLDIDVDVNTFHSLGIKIIAKDNSKKPDVEDEPRVIIKDYFKNDMYDDPMQLKRMIEYFGYYLNIPIDIEEFENLGQAIHYQKNLDLQTLRSKYQEQLMAEGMEGDYVNNKAEQLKRTRTTLTGETVKSLEEVMIANFLFLNGVDYKYEEEYPYPTATEQYRQYKPDFYLPEYELYIEHFGVTKEGTVPWLNEFEGRKYLEGMEWKRQTHSENGTELIETFSYLNKDGRLLETLRRKLQDKGVIFKEVDFIDIFNRIYDTENSNHFDQFIRFISSFLNLFKSNGYKYEMFDQLIKNLDSHNLFFYNRTKIFLEIAKPVYLFYQERLAENNKIDFNDMINEAADAVRNGRVTFPYKYIVIDEYQDVSVSRFNLIKEIRDITGAKILAVGDDWQSIFRFAGSDLNLFTSFQKYFAHSEMLKIENTYRNSQQLINYAGQFVMKNKKQIVKNLTSHKRKEDPIKLYGYVGQEVYRTLKHIIDEIVQAYGKQSEIMLLGRNNFDINVIGMVPEFKIIKTKEGVKVGYKKYPNLNMFFLTAHKSKGLEAENVIIINASNSITGFPNRMVDDPILSLVLTAPDQFLFAEERRLFYVALTRTENNTYILVPDMNMSSFAKELKEEFHIKYKIIEGNTIISNNPKCPRCVEGYLVLRENQSNKERFLGCTNYPFCNHTIKEISVLENPIKCKSCGGYMVRKRGSRGEFYGCTNFKNGCRNTNDIDKIAFIYETR